MILKPKFGIDKLLFGMKQKDVEALYGKANKQFKDEDGNQILVYNVLKMRLTFYEDEQFKLGYIIASNPDLQIDNKKLIGRNIADTKQDFPQFKSYEVENFDLSENHFNEDNWIIFVTEFDEITKIEMGAIINNNDEFDWKF
jgi:hypothetical protein